MAESEKDKRNRELLADTLEMWGKRLRAVGTEVLESHIEAHFGTVSGWEPGTSWVQSRLDGTCQFSMSLDLYEASRDSSHETYDWFPV